MTLQSSRWVIPAVLTLSCLSWGGGQAASGQDDWPDGSERYTVESLRGDYGVTATYGANVARALGTQVIDGHGNLKGSAIVNQPGANGARIIVSIRFTGTYTVNGNGTGRMSLTIFLSDGNTAKATEDFVVTRGKLREGMPVATEIVDAQEQPSAVIPGGVFVTHTYTRRPE